MSFTRQSLKQTKTKHIYRHRLKHTSIQTNRTTRQNNLHTKQAVQNKKVWRTVGVEKVSWRFEIWNRQQINIFSKERFKIG